MEATIVVSMFCMLIACTILLGFYGHDRAVMKSMANDLAFKGALWTGRYVSPTRHEVDYSAMKQGEEMTLDAIETEGYRQLEKRLLCGQIRTIKVYESILKNEVCVEITVDFKLWEIPVSCTVESSSQVIDSDDLPRILEETGE